MRSQIDQIMNRNVSVTVTVFSGCADGVIYRSITYSFHPAKELIQKHRFVLRTQNINPTDPTRRVG